MDVKFPILNIFKPPPSEHEYIAWRKELKEKREELRAKFNAKEYEREDLVWYRYAFLEHFTFMYDKSFYEHRKGYKIDEFLDHGQREFGGYDLNVLWQAYPRIGCDDRNQFDFYRDMPGGLEGLRKVVRRAHERGVKVFIDYNPWDTGTRREGKPDHEALSEIVSAIEADGVYLDTMSATDPEMRNALDRARPGIVFETEGSPSFEAAQLITGSWASFSKELGRLFFWVRTLHFLLAGTILTLRWLEPRHSIRIIDRNSHHRYEQLIPAFFNGASAVVWENVFGWWNPWSPEDRALLRKCLSILRAHRETFTSRNWEPLVPTIDPDVIANQWNGKDETVWTLVNLRYETITEEVLAVPTKKNARYYDAWNNIEIKPRQQDGETFLYATLEPRSAGCVFETTSPSWRPPQPDKSTHSEVYELTTLDDHKPKPVAPTPLAPKGKVPPDMVLIPAGEYTWKIEHRGREGACYDDISYNWAREHPIRNLKMKAFLIDKFPATNAEFKKFLDETGYKPSEPKNFLKHWVDGEISPGKEEHPVVYVDINDARAYAKWAGKRLPTEEEWQYAAQGTDGRFWPWGNEFSPDRCNSDSNDTTPVDAFPLGQSPFRVWDMAGNVWEMTESERDDGHSRYIILKGGSYYRAKGSIWYFDGGAQRCTWHAKFLLMWPGLDRCATIGFRCVKDAKQ